MPVVPKSFGYVQFRHRVKPPLCKGRWAKSLILLGGVVLIVTIPQSPQYGDSPLYTRGPVYTTGTAGDYDLLHGDTAKDAVDRVSAEGAYGHIGQVIALREGEEDTGKVQTLDLGMDLQTVEFLAVHGKQIGRASCRERV